MPLIEDRPQDVGGRQQETYSDLPPSIPSSPISSGEKPGRVRFDKALQRSMKRPAAPIQKALGTSDTPSTWTPTDHASLAQWYRAGLPPAKSNVRLARPSLIRAGANHRVLVAGGIAAPQARIQIGAGKLAGSQIHLALVNGRLEAQLLTATEGSRQTLIVAMDAVRERLQLRGLLANHRTSSSAGNDPKPGGRRLPFSSSSGEGQSSDQAIPQAIPAGGSTRRR